MVNYMRRKVRYPSSPLLSSQMTPNDETITPSHRYVNQILNRLPKSQLHLSTRVNCVSSVPPTTTVENERQKLELITDNDEKRIYDHVIFACHSNDALRILQSGEDILGEEEERILGSFEWNKNEVVLHSDPAVSVFL